MLFIQRLCAFITMLGAVSISASSFAAQKTQFEITPLIGYRFGGDFIATNNDTSTKIKLTEEIDYGLLLAWTVDRDKQGEFLLSHNNTEFSTLDGTAASQYDLAITYAHIGGNVMVSKGVVPLLVTGGFGLTHFSPEDSTLGNETRFSMNLGLATKIAVTDNLSLRFGGRVYATFFNSEGTVFCNEENCAISIDSDLWLQSELNAGIAFVF